MAAAYFFQMFLDEEASISIPIQCCVKIDALDGSKLHLVLLSFENSIVACTNMYCIVIA